MGGHRFSMTFLLGVAITGALLLPAICPAQDYLDATGEFHADTKGCPEMSVPLMLPSTTVMSCDKADPVEVIMPLDPDARGYSREKSVRGAYEFHEYQLPEGSQQEQTFETMRQLLGTVGFTVKFTSIPSTLTARKENLWVLINVGGDYYDVKVVHAKEEPWIPVKNALEISREMDAHQRVAIYGITFSADNQAVTEENSNILGEMLKYLKGNPEMALDVESHKTSKNGDGEKDQEITWKRATAVVAWLEAHGIAAGRLRPKALGRNKPITENDTPLEIQRNERIELAKAP